MSVYRQQSTNINDIDCLEDALKETKSKTGKNFSPERHEQKVNLKGYTGDTRKQQAELVLPKAQVGGAANDIGFERGEDGNFIAHISAYDSSHYNDKWLAQLKAKYAVGMAKKIAKQRGFTLMKTIPLPNGKTRLQFAVKT
jgi:hypothetical protein